MERDTSKEDTGIEGLSEKEYKLIKSLAFGESLEKRKGGQQRTNLADVVTPQWVGYLGNSVKDDLSAKAHCSTWKGLLENPT